MATKTDGRLRFAAVIAVGVTVTGLVTMGIARAYHASPKIVPTGVLSAPVEWVPPTEAPAPDAAASLAAVIKRVKKQAQNVYIPPLPDLGGVSPKSLGFQWPTRGYHGITMAFGPHDGNQFHHGTDIACGLAQPLYASKAGRVVFAGDAGSVYGTTVAIDHGNTYMTVYGHLSELNVNPGDVVATQEKIGLCGQTGNATGPHVHFELRFHGYVWDPMTFLR